MCDISFVNNVGIISQNPRVTAINSCIEVDLTGQVVSDSIGTRMYSGLYKTRQNICYFEATKLQDISDTVFLDLICSKSNW